MLSVAALVVLLNLATYDDLDEALDALDAGQPLGKVSNDIGLSATRRIRSTTSDEQLQRLIKVARAGRAGRRLDRALVRYVLARGPGARAAVRDLAALPQRRREKLVDPTSKQWVPCLEALLERTRGDDDAATDDAAILTLLIPHADLKLLSRHYREWLAGNPRRATLLLERLGSCSPALRPALFHQLLDRPAPEELAAPFRLAVRALTPDPKVAAQVAAALERSREGPHAAFLFAATALPPTLWKRASPGVVEALETDEPERLVMAIHAAAALLCPELVARLPELYATHQPSQVRIAAVEAITDVGYRDAPTIDRLIRFLSDKDRAVRKAAYHVLLRKAGRRVKLPLRVRDWQAWRAGQKLPDRPPLSDEERLAKQRALRVAQSAPDDD